MIDIVGERGTALLLLASCPIRRQDDDRTQSENFRIETSKGYSVSLSVQDDSAKVGYASRGWVTRVSATVGRSVDWLTAPAFIPTTALISAAMPGSCPGCGGVLLTKPSPTGHLGMVQCDRCSFSRVELSMTREDGE